MFAVKRFALFLPFRGYFLLEVLVLISLLHFVVSHHSHDGGQTAKIHLSIINFLSVAFCDSWLVVICFWLT